MTICVYRKIKTIVKKAFHYREVIISTARSIYTVDMPEMEDYRMNVVSELHDQRIESRNLLVELTIGEYLNFARDIIHKNEFQRRRVYSSKTVYSLLRSDLERGCIIPPVVLALTSTLEHANPTSDDFNQYLLDNKDHLVILDGLQRTHTMIDLVDSIESSGDEIRLNEVLGKTIRAEFYVGINRLGILYRMLTLNTGQSPMSLRQQIEIMYLDYANGDLGGIDLVREAEGRRATGLEQYNFKEIVEGFNSYLDRDELPIDRADLLENIRSLEKLSSENQDQDIFLGYVTSWHSFITKIYDLCGDAEVSGEFVAEHGNPFGVNAVQVFKKAQAMTGYGASVGKLRDFGIITNGFEEIMQIVDGIEIADPVEFLETINQCLLWIKDNTKKIGNAQRAFFLFFFRGMFNSDDDSFQDPRSAAETALRKYQSQNL